MVALPSTSPLVARDVGTGESRGPMLIGASMAILVLATTSIAVRFCSRIRSGGLAADDWTILASGVFLTTFVVICVCEVVYWDWGKHSWDVKPRTMSQHWHEWRIFAVTKLLFHYSTATIRISVCHFLRRLNPYESLRRGLTGFIAFNYFWMVFMTVRLLVHCTPVDQSIISNPRMRKPGTKCMSEEMVAYVFLSLQLVFDLITWSLPLVLVFKVRTSARKKVKIAALLCLGFLPCGVAALRLPASFGVLSSKDQSWDSALLHLFVALESGLGIVAASVPAMKPLLDDVGSKIASVFLSPRSLASDESRLAKEEGYSRYEP